MATLLGPVDQAFVEDRFTYMVQSDAGFVCVVVSQFPTGGRLTPAASDLLVRLPSGFPDAYPDMFWFADRVVRTDGRTIPATELVESYLNRSWFRWSRHVANQWRPGIDDLRSYIGYIRRCLVEAAA